MKQNPTRKTTAARRIASVFLRIVADWEAWAIELWSLMPRRSFIRELEFVVRGLDINRPFCIRRSLVINSAKMNITIGPRAQIGEHARFGNYDSISVGSDFVAGAFLTIEAGSHDLVSLMPIKKPVRIGNNVRCGARVTILSGVTIGDDVCVADGTLIVKDVPSGSVASGVPAALSLECKSIDCRRA